MDLEIAFHGSLVTEGLLGLASEAAGHRPTWAPDVPASTASAIAKVGDTTGEVWVHLLPLALEVGDAASPDDFLESLRQLPPVEMMEYVVGTNVPAWHDCVSPEALEAAAAGDPSAALTLLVSDRYYGGRAGQALPVLLQLGPDQAHECIVGALRSWFAEVVGPASEDLRDRHHRTDRGLLPGEAPLDAVERTTDGVRLEPESYTDRVALVAQYVRPGWQILAQHHSTRVVVYDGTAAFPVGIESTARVFAALGETTRLEILRALAAHPGGVSDLARTTGLAKSTVHQHLAVLRSAGLVRLAGQAWKYRYEVRADRISAATERVLDHLTGEGTG